MFYTSIKRKKFSTRKSFLWSHLFKETYLLTSAKELIIRWPLSWSPWLPNIILNYICPSWATSCHRSPSGWEGPLTHSSPEGRGWGGWVCCTSDLGLIPEKLANRWWRWQETDTSPGYLSSQFLCKERNTLKNSGAPQAWRKAMSLWAGERGDPQLRFHSTSPL